MDRADAQEEGLQVRFGRLGLSVEGRKLMRMWGRMLTVADCLGLGSAPEDWYVKVGTGKLGTRDVSNQSLSVSCVTNHYADVCIVTMIVDLDLRR